MAGMFYSLQEAAEKLNKTEDEVKQIVKEGKLREFRDGPNLLFKVEEVEALIPDMNEAGLEEVPMTEVPEPEEAAMDVEEPEGLEETPEPEESMEISELDDVMEIPAPEDLVETPEPEESAMEILEEETAESEAPKPSGLSAGSSGSSEILLAPETGAPLEANELTDADTALTGQGTSVLGGTDKDYEITEDTLAETTFTAGPTGSTPEVPLEELEEDVNLDTFGSGSGLLDLSLQADDTSLGGILDEIYTSESEGQEIPAAESDAAAITPETIEPAAAEDVSITQPMEVPVMAQPLIEAEPDSQSNILGMLMFLPLLLVIYTATVVMSGRNGVMPSILEPIQGFIWYIMGAAAVVSGLVVGAAFMLTGEKRVKTPKEKKPKKEKVKKEKKPKKEKKAKNQA